VGARTGIRRGMDGIVPFIRKFELTPTQLLASYEDVTDGVAQPNANRFLPPLHVPCLEALGREAHEEGGRYVDVTKGVEGLCVAEFVGGVGLFD
jgi:hypothetical protein